MITRRTALLFFFLSLPVLGQQNQSSNTCPATEQAVRGVTHEGWAAFRNRDVAKLDQLLDDNFLLIDDGGGRKTKPQVLAEFNKPEGNIHNEPGEQPADFSVVFTNGAAILSYTKSWTDYDKKMGISWGGTVRVTRVLACKDGKWMAMVYHETDIPNKQRPVSTSELDHLNDFVGRYRIGEKGELSITRKGDSLIETWNGEEAVELLPGKYDTFFNREDGWVERFVRDKSGKVTGILYTLSDGEFEAKRMP
jgi:hypothetical protein